MSALETFCQLQCTKTEYADRESWLEGRRFGIGASDSPYFFGVGYAGGSVYSLYWDKIGKPLADDEDEIPKRLLIGKELEPSLRRIFSMETGFHVVDAGEFTIYRSNSHEFICASLDGFCLDDEGDLCVLELKNVNEYAKNDWKDGDSPVQYQVQVQHELAVTGLKKAYLMALVGGQEPKIVRIDRNDSFIKNSLVPACVNFWVNHVEARVPPEVDGSQATARALQLLHPNDNGESVLLPDAFVKLDEKLQKIKKLAKRLENAQKGIENQIKSTIGAATFGELPNGVSYSWKTQHTAGYYVEPRDSRVLRRSESKPKKSSRKV